MYHTRVVHLWNARHYFRSCKLDKTMPQQQRWPTKLCSTSALLKANFKEKNCRYSKAKIIKDHPGSLSSIESEII